MSQNGPRTAPRHEPQRVYEHAPDPAEAANRPLEPKEPDEHVESDPKKQADDPHHRLNTEVGEPDPVADSDPYRRPTPEEEADRASGTEGAGQGNER